MNWDLSKSVDTNQLPDDTYLVSITSATWRTAKSNTAHEMLTLELTVQAGDYFGRKIFHNLNLINSNPLAVNIAMQELRKILSAIGRTKESASVVTREMLNEILPGGMMYIKVKTDAGGFSRCEKFIDVREHTTAAATTTIKKESVPF